MARLEPPPTSPLAKRIARIDRDVYALREQVASLHRSVAFLQEVGCVLCLVFIALAAVGVFVLIYVGDAK